MFNNLANYLLGLTGQEQDVVPRTRHDDDDVLNVRLTAVVGDDDWVLVDRDSEGDTDMSSSLESIPGAFECDPHSMYKPVAILTRTSSTSSLPCTNIEESWFLTPPPCFTSAGPVHMETSPLENLLIEHPSMSVYQHSVSQPAIAVAVTMTGARNRHSSAPGTSSVLSGNLANTTATAVAVLRQPQLVDVDDDDDVPVQRRHAEQNRRVVLMQPRHVDTLKQQERQCVKIKNAQKLQIQKACQSLKRGYFERNNKAREVNNRNHRQRRGEKSQGSARSNANNNRKC